MAARSSVCHQSGKVYANVAMQSHILLSAAHLTGKRPDMTTITGHKEFVELTAQRAAAMTELCSIKSVKGPV